MANIQELKAQRKADAVTFKNLSGKEAMGLRTSDPAQYAQLRAAAVAEGIIHGAPGVRRGLEIRHYVDVQPAPTTAEIKARIAYSQAEVEKFYRNQGNANPAYDLARLARTDPSKYEQVRQAAMSYNIIERSESRPQRKPVDAAAGSTNPIILGERLAKLTGLPATTEISADQLFELNEHVNAMDAAKVKS